MASLLVELHIPKLSCQQWSSTQSICLIPESYQTAKQGDLKIFQILPNVQISSKCIWSHQFLSLNHNLANSVSMRSRKAWNWVPVTNGLWSPAALGLNHEQNCFSEVLSKLNPATNRPVNNSTNPVNLHSFLFASTKNSSTANEQSTWAPRVSSGPVTHYLQQVLKACLMKNWRASGIHWSHFCPHFSKWEGSRIKHSSTVSFTGSISTDPTNLSLKCQEKGFHLEPCMVVHRTAN